MEDEKKPSWLPWSPKNIAALKASDPELCKLVESVFEAAKELFAELGPGYEESVYREGLAVELRAKQVPFRQEAAHNVYYKGHCLGRRYLDFVISERLALEVKVGANNLSVDQRTQGESAHHVSGCDSAMLFFSRSNRVPELEILDRQEVKAS